MTDQNLHEELRRGVERDYDLAFDAHARAARELRAADEDLHAALTLAHRDPVRQAITMRWCQARAAERIAGKAMERCGQTVEALSHNPREQR